MAKWLDKYEQGGLVLKQKTKDNYGKKPNPNDVTVSSGPNYVGMGNDITGRDYSPAWGGQFQSGGFLEPISYKLPSRYRIPYAEPSTELATSIGGEKGEPAYLIPTFKGGKDLKDPVAEYRKTGEHLGGPFKTWQEAEKWEQEIRHPYVEKGKPIPTPLKRWGDMAMGGSLPGAVGFTYARVAGSAPANGKYTKKTKASAQNGKEMKFYQDGLDFKPNSIAQDGKKLTKAGCPPGHVNIDGRCIDTQSVAYDKLRNYGIGYFDKDNVFNTSTSDLPEVVVKSKSASDFINSTVQSFSDRTTDESGNSVYTPVTPGQKYAFDQIGKQYGFPEVKSQEKYVDENPYSFYSFGHGHYADNTVYADNLTTYLKELPHHLQRKTLKKDWILNDLPAYIKGEDPYNVKGTTEYAAHSIIEPNIRDQFDEYENEYNKRFVRKDISPKEILKKWGIPAKKKQDGGAIVDPMGQWAHPGEVTIIPATNITMEGVDYPVLGISDTGDQQMMYPGEDYNFDGEYVTEYPMMKNGGWLDKYK